jgi:hypothetical protein
MISFRYCRILKVFVLLLLVALVSACATTPLGRADLLDFIEDGKTSREQTYLSLGEPTSLYEEGRILCFRLGQDGGGYFVVGKGWGWAGIKTSLIMAFDDEGVLSRHSLVQVKGP